MTFSSNGKNKVIRDYYYSLQDKYGTKDLKEIHRKIIEDFKTKPEPKILVVTDMLITGFDAPNLWTMYLDKPLQEHRILQAIARTNRPFPNKKFGLIVDYIGVLKDLERAFQKYEAKDAKDLRVVIRDLEKEKAEFAELLQKALEFFEGIKIEDTHESLEEILDRLTDPDRAEDFEITVKELMRSYEMLQRDPFIVDFLEDCKTVVKIYIAYYNKFKKAKVDELKIDRLSKKTIQLIQETIDIKEIESQYQAVNIDENYIQVLMKSLPKTSGGAIDIVATIQHEAKAHPFSPFFIDLSREIERTYQDLRTRKIITEDAIKKMLSINERIVDWKKEEKEIGSDKYPVYEALKFVLPDIEKNEAMDFTNNLLSRLEGNNLLFKGWQEQREVRRRIRAETMILLLSRFKDRKKKVDELLNGMFEALEASR